MRNYIIKRVAQSVLILFCVMFIIYALIRSLPKAMRRNYVPAPDFGRAFFEPYATPTGQVILACLLAAYVLSLIVLRRMTMPRRRERILRSLA